MLGVISHDAGGAEILSSYVRQQGIECVYSLDGPARKIFERKLGRIKIKSMHEVVDQSKSILCGTSWQSDIEIRAIELARKLKKPSVAFVDHWINYRERFVRSGELYLPDEIWVGDSLAEDMVKAVFPGQAVRLIDNPYFNDIRRELIETKEELQSPTEGTNILYVCEPIREHALQQHGDERYWGYVEEDALRYFLSNIDLLNSSVASINIRLHPSEAINKYNWVLSEFDLPITIAAEQALIKQIAANDIVVGCESMAMVIALLSNKRVISSIPSNGRACALPHPEIEKLQTIVETTH